MKIFSDNAITKSDLDAVDAKQNRSIKQLRIALALVFAANLAFTIAIKFF